jgi:acetyltransferase-like isoleucine patch superfamily enzyme
VGAGTIATRNIPSFSVIAEVSARVIRDTRKINAYGVTFSYYLVDGLP